MDGLSLCSCMFLAIRDQFFMLLLSEDRAVAALSEMIGPDTENRRQFVGVLETVCEVGGELTGERSTRLATIKKQLGMSV